MAFLERGKFLKVILGGLSENKKDPTIVKLDDYRTPTKPGGLSCDHPDAEQRRRDVLNPEWKAREKHWVPFQRTKVHLIVDNTKQDPPNNKFFE